MHVHDQLAAERLRQMLIKVVFGGASFGGELKWLENFMPSMPVSGVKTSLRYQKPLTAKARPMR
jgi:hypothetical protein